MKLLEEIAKWKLEAKLEDTERYFYHLKEVDQITNGEKAYVIGRKGSGKTAIAEYLCKIREPKIFAVKLTFKNFPFNELYELSHDSYTSPNQYISLWRYIILSFICNMMVVNENINPEIREKLEKIYSVSGKANLRRVLQNWLKISLKISVPGCGFELKIDPTSCQEDKKTCLENADILEDIILKNIDNSKYFIIFDELDEDYKNIIERAQYTQYTDLLVGLFKAVQDIRATFTDPYYSIYPVIFLRDDIYDLIQDSDKNKWVDLMIQLDWDLPLLRNLLAFRLSRAIDADAEPYNFKYAWSHAFTEGNMRIGKLKRKKVSIFYYITKSTHLRPRDYIRYLQLCATAEIDKKQSSYISAQTVKDQDKAFSNYLRNEIVDEIHGAIPDIQPILDIFSMIRKNQLAIREFKEVYNAQFDKGIIKTPNQDFVLQVLFHFSVIGNQPSQKNVTVFRYENKEARLNYKEALVIHRGLLKSLQIV